MLHLSWSLAAYGLAGLALYIIAGSIYRLYFHRLSHIPGPKLAALTYHYQSWFDIYYTQGRWLWQCEALHERYGPIIRVGPDEIHIKDPTFYNTAFGTSTKKRDKSRLWYWFAEGGTLVDGNAFATMGHDRHAHLRAAMSGFFSKRKVQALEDRVKIHVGKMKERMAKAGQTGEVLNLMHVTAALTLDVISEYSFGKSANALDEPDLGEPVRKMLEDGVTIHPFGRQFPPVARFMMKTAGALAPYLPSMASFRDFEAMLDDMTKPPYEKAMSMKEKTSEDEQTSIVEAVAHDPNLSLEDRSFQRIRAEGFNLIGAGTETTARTVSVGFYHILANPKIHNTLLTELCTLIPTPTSPLPTVAQLSQLPYLTACLHESTRIAHGVAGRLVRIAPDEDIICSGYTIPRGSTFGMSHYFQHRDPTYFPDPDAFIPERYLVTSSKTQTEVAETMRFLVPFGKGPRMCIGMNLAWSEMYLSVAALISGFEGGKRMELVETGIEDVTVDKEYFLGVYKKESKGVKVRVVKD